MLGWLRKKDEEKVKLTLTSRALDSRNLQILRTTLAVLRLPQSWQLEPEAEEGVVLVDVDRAAGRRQWRELVDNGQFYRVVPVTSDDQLRRFAKGLGKPIRAKQLEDLLRELGNELTEEQADDVPVGGQARQILICEAMVQSPHARFAVHLSDGHWFYVERDRDRLFSTGGVDSLVQRLFQPLHRMGIRPIKVRPESFGSGTDHEEYSLSLLLWSAAQSHPDAARLNVFRGDRYYRMHRAMPWNKLPHQPEDRVLMDYIKSNGPIDLMTLVLEIGLSPEKVLAFMAGAWLLGAVVPLPGSARRTPAE